MTYSFDSPIVEHLAQEISVHNVMNLFGLEANSYFRHYFCPFHPETNPSFKTYPSKEGKPSTFCCYSCHKGGNSVYLHFLLSRERNQFHRLEDTVEQLCKIYKIDEHMFDNTVVQTAIRESQVQPAYFLPKEFKPDIPKEYRQMYYMLVVDYFNSRIPMALIDFLKQRGCL